METVEQVRALEVVFKLLRALAHRVRGDLSVLNNDLAYLATVVGESEVERSRGRLTQIAATMGDIGALNHGAGAKKMAALEALSPIISGCENILGGEMLNGLFVVAQREQILLVGRIFSELFGSWNRVEVSREERDILRVMLTPKASCLEKLSKGAVCSSITEIVEVTHGERGVVKGGVVDLIFFAHAWQGCGSDCGITVRLRHNSPLL